MNNWEKQDERIRRSIHQAVDQSLSHLEVNPSLQAQILREARGEKKVKRKISAGLVLAVVLLLAMAAIGLAAARYGVLEFRRDQQENAAYIEHILTLDETYENEYMTMTINDAVFDGTHLTIAMDVQPKEGCGDGVYLYPSVTATCGDEALDVDVDSCRGDFFEGFWVPELDPGMIWVNGQYGADYVIFTESEDGGFDHDPQTDAVTWTMSFDIIRPLYPLEAMQSEYDEADEPLLAWEMEQALFTKAYEEGKILLYEGCRVLDYAWNLPKPAHVTEEAWTKMNCRDRLVESGAFERVERVSISFETQESGIRVLEAPQTFDLGDYEATVKRLSLSFSHCDYEIEVTKKPGFEKTAGQEYVDEDGQWYFAVLAEGCRTQMDQTRTALAYGDEENPSPSVVYEGTVTLTGKTDSVTFVPDWGALVPIYTDQPDAAVYEAQHMLTKEQEALAFTVTLR